MENFNYYERLKRSLEDVIAFEEGDTSRCKVLEPVEPETSSIGDAALRSGKRGVLSRRKIYQGSVRRQKREPKIIEIKVRKTAERQG